MDRERKLKVLKILNVVHRAMAYRNLQPASSRRRKRRMWVREIYAKRQESGFYETTFQILKSKDPEMFFKTFRMSVDLFNILLEMVQESIQKHSIRKSIAPECRLALTLIYLAHGAPRQVLGLKFKMSPVTVGRIILETSKVLWEKLNEIYLPRKNADDWRKISADFQNIWNFPNCVGALDGKHVNIVCPPNAGSEFWNYKHRHSIVLLAACDAHYIFTAIDIGSHGSRSDGGVLSASNFGQQLLNGSLNLPADEVLPGTQMKVPFFFVGDAAFPLRTNLMRPYPGRNLQEAEENFNKRLSRARRTIENAFGIMSARWRVLLQDIHCLPDNATTIVSACVILHNFMKIHCTEYCTPAFADHIHDGNEVAGLWRNSTRGLVSTTPFGRSNNAAGSSYNIRDNIKNYLLQHNK